MTAPPPAPVISEASVTLPETSPRTAPADRYVRARATFLAGAAHGELTGDHAALGGRIDAWTKPFEGLDVLFLLSGRVERFGIDYYVQGTDGRISLLRLQERWTTATAGAGFVVSTLLPEEVTTSFPLTVNAKLGISLNHFVNLGFRSNVAGLWLAMDGAYQVVPRVKIEAGGYATVGVNGDRGSLSVAGVPAHLGGWHGVLVVEVVPSLGLEVVGGYEGEVVALRGTQRLFNRFVLGAGGVLPF